MAARYILAGGADVKNPSYWTELRKVLKSEKPLRVLSCQFSRAEAEWQEGFDSFNPYFKIAFGEDMTAELAQAENLEQQIKNADVIYLHGGHTDWLKNYLAPFNVEKLFEGKIVIGSSAGAQFISTRYWLCGNRRVGKGRALTPLNVIVHYGSDFGSDDPRGPIDWGAARLELQNAVGDQEITEIREGEFVELTV